MSGENKRSWTGKILKTLLLSPVNITFAVASVYLGMKAYSWEPSFPNQIIFFAVIGLWIFWIVARYMVVLFVILALAGSGYYAYHQYSTREMRQCEAAGGVWNKETKTCEEKVGFVEKFISRAKQLVIDVFSPETNKETDKKSETTDTKATQDTQEDGSK